MANKATIEANIKVTGLSELEKAESVLKSIDKALSSLGKGNSSGFSGMANDLNKAQAEAKQLEANLKDVKNVNLSNVGDKASDGLKKAGNAAEKLTTELKNVDRVNLSDIGTKASEGLNKAKAKADELNAELKRASQIDGSLAGKKIGEGLKLADRSADNLSASIKKSTSAERELANAAKDVARAEKESANAAKQGAQAREQAAQASKRAAQEQLSLAKQQEKEPGKIRSAFKEAVGAYTLGNLGANAIMSAGQGIRNIFSGGLDYIKEQQTSQVAWSTNAQSVAKVLGNEMSAKEAQKFSKKMTRDLQGLALSAGNDYSMVSDAALAFYATGKEVSTAGDKKKSMMLTKDMLNLQDAGGLNDAQMQNFVQAVAKSLDQNALSSERMQQLLAANPLYDDFIKKAYQERTGKEWKQGEDKFSDFTGEDVVNATHMMASLNGVKNASENMNNSLEGVIRSMKNGSKFLAGNYLSKMAEQLNKSFGGDGKLFSRLSSFFTDEKKMSKTADALAKSSSKVVDSIGKTAREFYNVGKDFTKLAKPFASGFAKDFVNEIKDIASGVKSAYGTLKSTAGKIKDKLPKGSGKVFSDISNTLGSATGKATAFLVAIRGFSKLPGMAGVAQKIMSPLMNTLGKLPIVGKTLSGIISKITGIKPQRELSAASKMQGAADKMMAAANKMNGGGPGGSGSGATSTKNSPQIFDEDGGTFYRDKNGRVKKPFKGKGAFKGEFNPYLGMDYVPGKTTRVGRYHTGRTVVATPRSNALIARGTEILEAAQTTRSGRGRWNTLKGNTLVKLGNAGSTIASSGVGRGVSAVGRGLRGAGTFLKGGAPMMNAAFSGLEALTVMGTTKSGSLERHQGVGSAVGSGVGATIGMAAGSLLGPVGTIAGGALGGWLGGKAGEWFGGKYNEKYGKKPQKTEGQKISEAQQKALDRINSRQWQDAYTGAMSADAENPQEAAKGYKAQAKKNYKLMEAAAKSTSSKAQEAQLELDNAISSGDKSSIAKWEKKLASEVKKDDTNKVKSASKQAEKKSSKVKDLENAVYKKQLEDVNKGIISGRKSKKEREKEAKRRTKELLDQDKDYKKAKSEAEKARKSLEKAKKDYKEHNGEAYKEPKKKNTGASKKEKSPKKSSSKSGSKKKTPKTPKKRDTSKSSNKNANGHKKEAASAKNATKALNDLNKVKKDLNKQAKGPKVKAKSSPKRPSPKIKLPKDTTKALKDLNKLKSKKAKVSLKTSGQKDLKKAASSMKRLKNKKTKASIKLSGDKKLGKVNKDLKKFKNKKAKVSLSIAGQNKFAKVNKDLKKIKNKKAKVTASVSGQAKLKRLTSDMKRVKNKRAKVTASVSGQNKVRAIGKDIGKVKNKKATVSVSAVGGAKLGALNTNIKRVKGKNVKVTAQASGQGKVQGLSGAIKQVKDKNAKVTGTVTGTDKVKGLHSAINNLKDKAVKALANVSGTSQVQALVSAINAVRSKTITITANVKKNGNAAAGTPGAKSAFNKLWTGTPSFGNTTSSPAGGGSWASNGGTKAGMYLVNDAPGTDFVEAFKLKNGLVGLFPKQRNLYVPLEEGTQVLNAKDTKKMFKLEKGTPSFDLKMPNLRKLSKGTPGQNTVVEKGDNTVQKTITNNNTFNFDIKVEGGSNGNDQNLANMIANAIGEKLLQQFPATEV